MTTSSLSPTAPRISITSAGIPGGVGAFSRTPKALGPESYPLSNPIKPARADGFGIGRNGVLQITEHHVDLRNQLRNLGAHLFDVWRYEMNHALELDRKLSQRRRRADRKRPEKIARKLHSSSPHKASPRISRG